MMLKVKTAIAATILALGFLSCSDDEQKVEEPVQPTTTEQDVAAPGDDAGQRSPTEAVYFAFDDYTLNSEAQAKLNGLADHLKNSKGAVVQIEGHCDERGSVEYNLALGERRAQSIKNYLSQLGLDAARLTTISYGEEKPAVEGHDESAWSKNRRGEFVISSQ